MKEINNQAFLGFDFDIDFFLQKFEAIASGMNISLNHGGMHASGLFNLAIALSKISPVCLIELGVFKGMSSSFVKDFFQDALRVYCFDPRVENWQKLIPFKREDIEYSSSDFATPVMGKLPEMLEGVRQGGVCCFADDHQDAFERLLICAARNIEWIIFDDDYRERADHRSFYMLLQQAADDFRLSSLLSLLVDSYVTLPDLAGWKKTFPACERVMHLDTTGHYRRCTVVKLVGKFPEGWTAGKLSHSGDHIIRQEIFSAM